MTASKELLEKLHDSVSEHLLARIESGEATASEVAQAVKFLKDNGIDVMAQDDNPLGQLGNSMKKMPFSSVEDPTSH